MLVWSNSRTSVLQAEGSSATLFTSNAGMAEWSNAPDLKQIPSGFVCLKGETQDCFREQSGLSAIVGSNPTTRISEHGVNGSLPPFQGEGVSSNLAIRKKLAMVLMVARSAVNRQEAIRVCLARKAGVAQ